MGFKNHRNVIGTFVPHPDLGQITVCKGYLPIDEVKYRGFYSEWGKDITLNSRFSYEVRNSIVKGKITDQERRPLKYIWVDGFDRCRSKYWIGRRGSWLGENNRYKKLFFFTWDRDFDEEISCDFAIYNNNGLPDETWNALFVGNSSFIPKLRPDEFGVHYRNRTARMKKKYQGLRNINIENRHVFVKSERTLDTFSGIMDGRQEGSCIRFIGNHGFITWLHTTPITYNVNVGDYTGYEWASIIHIEGNHNCFTFNLHNFLNIGSDLSGQDGTLRFISCNGSNNLIIINIFDIGYNIKFSLNGGLWSRPFSYDDNNNCYIFNIYGDTSSAAWTGEDYTKDHEAIKKKYRVYLSHTLLDDVPLP